MTGHLSSIPCLPGPDEPVGYVSIPLRTGLVGGRPGIGKSALADRLVRAVTNAQQSQSPAFPAAPAGEEHTK